MVWALGILVVVIIVLGLWAARGRLGQLGPQLPDRPGPDLPDGPVRAEDLDAVRFAVVTRGYDMEQVDAVLARLAEQLAATGDAAAPSTQWPAPDAPQTTGSISTRPMGDNGGTSTAGGVQDNPEARNQWQQ